MDNSDKVKEVLLFQVNRSIVNFYKNHLTMIEDLKPSLVDSTVEMVPFIFMGVSIPIIVVGARLLKTRPRRPKKNYLEDSDNF